MVLPTGTVMLAGEMTIASPGTAMVAEATTFPLVTEVAVTVTVRSPNVGAVYVVGVPLVVAAGDMLPHWALTYAPARAEVQDTSQLTPAFAGSFATVAVTCRSFPG